MRATTALVAFAFVCVVSAAYAYTATVTRAAVQPLPRGGQYGELPQWENYCSREPEDCKTTPAAQASRFVVTATRLLQLKAVDLYVNHTVKYMTDKAQYGVVDYWGLPYSGYGDCEDYALFKRHLLLLKGWPSERLLISVVKDGRQGHAVLLADIGSTALVLDNSTDHLVRWNKVTYFNYRLRQSYADPNIWVSMRQAKVALAAQKPPSHSH